MGWMDDAMKELRPWIGRVRVVEDDIGLMAVRRVAATFDVDPESFKAGSELPPHWFGVFFGETIRQGELGPDGHPNKGIVLPPIPMPRRMGAGRRVQILGRLRAGEPARKKAEVADIVPKTGRSGDIFVLTMRHTIEQAARTVAVDDLRRHLSAGRAAGPEDDGNRAYQGAHRPCLDRDHQAHEHAQLPLRRTHLERAPDPL